LNMSLEISYQVLIRRQLSDFGFVNIPSSGYSMFPSIRPGDVCQFSPIDQEQLQIGDILLFVNVEGKLIGHRLIRMTGSNEATIFECKGDTNNYPDMTVARDRMLGKLAMIRRVNRKGKSITIPANHYLFSAWGKVMLRLPILSSSLRKLAILINASHVQHEQRQ
jgi:signal peptidase